jgi:hypothetical protein
LYYKGWDLHKPWVAGYFEKSSPLPLAGADFLLFFLSFSLFAALSRSRDGPDARSAEIPVGDEFGPKKKSDCGLLDYAFRSSASSLRISSNRSCLR